MEGEFMNQKELFDLLTYVRENNGWGTGMISRYKSGKRIVKYVSVNFDTRDGTIYYVKFWGGFDQEKEFRIENSSDLKKVYQWLNDNRGDSK